MIYLLNYYEAYKFLESSKIWIYLYDNLPESFLFEIKHDYQR